MARQNLLNRFEMPVRYISLDVPIIRMRGISKTFKTAAGETPVLKGIDVDIQQGQFVAVVGRSGSGKSTLVNMITGVDRPTSGTVEVGNLPIQKMPESAMAPWRGKNLGIVFQFFQLLPMLTLVENVMLPMDFCNIYAPASREPRALDLLRMVGLEEMAHKLPGAIAGGQQQSAAVARALANDPPILIADEPTGNLDSATAEQVMRIFENLSGQGKTILMVTHDRTLARRANRLLLISDGELVHETLSKAFPDAPHPLLLQLSKQSTELRLEPGEYLPPPAGADTPLYLLEQGDLYGGENGETQLNPGSGLLDPLAMRGRLHAGAEGACLLSLPRVAAQSLHTAPARTAVNPDAGSKPRKEPRRWWQPLRRTK